MVNIQTETMCKMSQYTDQLFYLDRAIFEKTSLQSGAFGLHMTFLFQEAFQSSDLPQIPAENWTHALYADRHTYTHTHTYPLTHTHIHTQTCRYSNKKIPTINQQVQVFSIVFTLSVYTTNLQVLFTNQLFFTVLLQVTDTHIHTRFLKTRCKRFSEHLLLQNTRSKHTYAYTLCSLPAACWPSGSQRRCQG